jgi:hypothetical protein
MTGRVPFFLGIGFSRSGTSWLHQQLTNHPMVWMPPVKELHYWTIQREQGMRNKYYARHFRDMRAMSRIDKLSTPLNRKLCRDYIKSNGFWALRYFLGRRSDRWYRGLFPRAGFAACGEITPNYVFMGESRIEAVHRFDPSAKIIVVIRNPIDRAWSMAAKRFTLNTGGSLEQISDEVLRGLCLQTARKMRYQPAIAQWQKRFGTAQLHIAWYDELAEDKPRFLRGVADFLGIEAAPFLRNTRLLEKRQNAIDFRGRSMPLELRREMAEALLPMTEELAAAAGGCAVAWVDEIRATIAG